MPKPRNLFAPKKGRGGQTSETPAQPEKVRLNKWLADTGVCSRREADRLIVAGEVTVNGRVETTLGILINPLTVRVSVGGKTVYRRVNKSYVLYHKPGGLITSRHDPQGRPTIYSTLPDRLQHLDPVGRLDKDSSGALLLSDDGDWIHQLSHPKFHVHKTYRVTVMQPIVAKKLKPLLDGILLEPEGVTARVEAYTVLGTKLLELVLVTGYNRQIRRMLESLGYEVSRLKRTAVGPLHLGSLPPGACRPLKREELRAFLSSKF